MTMNEGETMLKKLFAILGLGCIITVLLVGCGGGSRTGPNPVHMSGTTFAQNSITIKKGESITLIKDDLFGSHTIPNGTLVNGTAPPATQAGGPTHKEQESHGRH